MSESQKAKAVIKALAGIDDKKLYNDIYNGLIGRDLSSLECVALAQLLATRGVSRGSETYVSESQAFSLLALAKHFIEGDLQ